GRHRSAGVVPRERHVGVHHGRGYSVRRWAGGVPMSAKLAAPVAIVTGGASGLGEAIVERLASDGHRVAVADVDEARGEAVAENVVVGGGLAEAMLVDVTSEGEVAACVEAVVERHGRLDALVCSAAVETRASLLDCTDGAWQRVLDVNVKGPFL